MRKAGGYGQMVGPAGLKNPAPKHAGVTALYEYGETDSFTCGHCQRVVLVPPRCDPADLGGLCKQCMNHICPNCLGKGCTPWEKAMEISEARHEALRSYGLI